MKTKNLLIALVLLLAFTGTAWAQRDTLYQEYFTGGQMNLVWSSAWPEGDNMVPEQMQSPSGDGWVGKVGNELSGGGVGTAIAGNLNLTDYEYSANIYTTVNSGTFNGIVARCDTVGGIPAFYSLQSDFDADQRLRLRSYDGANVTPIATWTGSQIPGGVPAEDSWNNMKIAFIGNQIRVYWNGTELSGSPFTDSDHSRGFFGVYVWNMPDNDETYCDDIIVLGESTQPYDLVAQNNTFLDETQQPMELRAYDGQTIYFSLDWDAVNGVGTAPRFDVTLKLDNVEIFRTQMNNVTPNTSWTTPSNPWVATLGSHTLEWNVDSENNVAESNEDNNVLTEDFLVLAQNAYDFSADSAWVAMPDTTPYLTDPSAGDPVRFVLFWSVPMGTAPMNAFNITLDVDGGPTFHWEYSVFMAQQGQTYMLVSDPWTAVQGTHYFIWEIDPTNLVEEFNEYNNSIMEGLEVGPPSAVRWDENGVTLTPQDLSIIGVYPNPFNPTTTLKFENKQPGNLKLTIFDVSGREVAVLTDGFRPQGVWELTWQAEKASAGTYFAVLEGLGQRSVQQIQLVK